jgi:hypothetical protein
MVEFAADETLKVRKKNRLEDEVFLVVKGGRAIGRNPDASLKRKDDKY